MYHQQHSPICVLAALLLILSSCNPQEQSNRNDKSAFLQKLELKKEELNNRIDQISKKSKNLSKEAQFEIQSTLQGLKSERIKLERTIKRANKASAKELEHLNREAREIFEDSEKQLLKIKKALED